MCRPVLNNFHRLFIFLRLQKIMTRYFKIRDLNELDTDWDNVFSIKVQVTLNLEYVEA